MNRINVNFCGVEFKNPVIPASGTFGYGREYEQFYPLSKLGRNIRKRHYASPP